MREDYAGLTYQLYRDYQGTGKMIGISNWEGDNELYCNSAALFAINADFRSACDAQRDVGAAVEAYRELLTLRHEGISLGKERARREGFSGVRVVEVTEISPFRLIKGLRMRGLLDDVLPFVPAPDYVSYSAWESIAFPDRLVADLTELQRRCHGRLIIGEFGFDRGVDGSAAEHAVRALSAMRRARVSYALWWQIFDQPPLMGLGDKGQYGLYDDGDRLTPVGGRLLSGFQSSPPGSMKIRSRHIETTEAIAALKTDLARLGRYHTIELPDGTVLPGLQTTEQLRYRLSHYPIPSDLAGKRVLDIGAWDGWFSFEMERRGAEVVAVDIAEQPGFLKARRLLSSSVKYVTADVCRLTSRAIGKFDIVLFLGVLYHVKHPLLALERVCELTDGIACIESFVTDDASQAVPLMEFYEGSELAGQFDNWVGPNLACLLAFCRTAGFARAELNGLRESRAYVTCYRDWQEAERAGARPELLCLENTWSHDHSFSTSRDDYLTLWCASSIPRLDCDRVQIRIGPYGARPVSIEQAGENRWQITCKLAPGLSQGWHAVRVSVSGSTWSFPSRIPVDMRSDERRKTAGGNEPLRITRVIDGVRHVPGRVWAGGPNSSVSAWVRGLPVAIEPGMVSLRLDGADLPAIFVSPPDEAGTRQVNAIIPARTQPGEYWITANCGDLGSNAVAVELVADEPDREASG